MGFFEVLLVGVALSMDAAAVSMSNGMCQKKIKFPHALFEGGVFGGFQAAMPLAGFFLAALITSAFMEAFTAASSILSFILLGFLGGRMAYGAIKEMIVAKKAKSSGNVEGATCPVEGEKISIGKLLVQAVATSIDAFAVGVAFQMEALKSNLPLGIFASVGIIGVTTFVISVAAVYLGKLLGGKLADKAELLGGLVLVGIGIKLLVEGLL